MKMIALHTVALSLLLILCVSGSGANEDANNLNSLRRDLSTEGEQQHLDDETFWSRFVQEVVSSSFTKAPTPAPSPRPTLAPTPGQFVNFVA